MDNKNIVSSEDSRLIHTLRFPLVCLVVVIHSFSFIKGWEISELDFSNLSGADLYSLFCISLSMTLAHIAVPVFLLISGYLFFNGLQTWNWQTYRSKLNKRVTTLLVPYLAWNSIYILQVVGTRLGGVILKGKPIWRIVEWWDGHNGILMYYHADSMVERINWLGGEGMFSFPILVPMWYIRDLMVLCLISPFIYWLLCRKRGAWRYVALAIIVIIYVTAIYPFVPGLSPGPLLFFSIGALFSLGGLSITGSFGMVRVTAIIIFFVLWIPLIPLAGYRTAAGNWLYPWFIMAGVATIINLFAWLMKDGRSTRFLKYCQGHETDVFFIFAAHNMLLPYIDKVLMKGSRLFADDGSATVLSMANEYPLLLIICYVIKIVIVISLCIMLSRFIKIRLPKTWQLLTGRIVGNIPRTT